MKYAIESGALTSIQRIGRSDALTSALDISIACAAVDQLMEAQPDYWRQRPLSKQALEYASKDVQSLLQLAKKQEAALSSLSGQLTGQLSLMSSQM